MAGKDDFFELRGDSLSLVRLTLAIEGFGMKMQYQVNSLLGWNSRRRLLSIVALSLFIASSSVGASPTQNRFL